MREALKEAQIALERDEVPVGCVVVHKKRVIAKSHNLTQLLKDPTAHAEMQAITSAAGSFGGKYMSDMTIYVTLEPCPMCAAALNWAQVTRLVYGADDPKRGYTLFSPNLLHPKCEVTKGVLQEECSSIIKGYFREKRNNGI